MLDARNRMQVGHMRRQVSYLLYYLFAPQKSFCKKNSFDLRRQNIGGERDSSSGDQKLCLLEPLLSKEPRVAQVAKTKTKAQNIKTKHQMLVLVGQIVLYVLRRAPEE